MGVCVVAPATGMVRLTCARSPRVTLLTDAGSSDTIPELVRAVTNGVSDAEFGNLSWVGKAKIPDNFDGALIWCKGETPMGGSAADWRRPFFSQPNCHAWVAVNWPYLEHADLVGLEPRILLTNAKRMLWNPLLRIAGSHPTEKRRTAWRANGEPWARLSLALWLELERPGSGLDSLLELWHTNSHDPQFSSLVLRNLTVVLMKCGNWTKAEELLDLGEKAFPGYAEFPYLHAVFFILQQSPSKAVRFLEAALKCGGREFVGGGGENSYRARFLLGTICNMVGQQEKAVNYWIPCTMERPAFGPAVRALAEQQIPRPQARWLHFPLAEMARREPQYAEPVVDFMIAHKMVLPARRLIETMPIEKTRRERLLGVIGKAESRLTAQPRTSAGKPGILLTGPVLDASGHARINRAIGLALLDSPKFETSLDPTTWPTLSRQTLKHVEALWEAAGRQITGVDLTIRHQWPPNFERTASGKLICILPWEHNAVPVRWTEEIEAKVDEVWTPSEFTRNAFVTAGLSPERVQVLPNAVDRETFRPDGPATRPPNSRGFVFLFVGGPIRRKGIDLLLQAYGDAFMPDDDVTLVIKDLGSRSFYSHNTRLGDVYQFAARSSAPHTLVITEEMDDPALAALYRGADAFVLPYRGEGFGMPLIEAMACGKPIITTGRGPAAEFCSAEDGYLLPAREVPVPEPAPPLGRLSSEWTWFEPDVTALAHTMRHVFEHRDEAAARGQRAAAGIQRGFTWERILPIYLKRIEQLVTGSLPITQQI